MKKIQALLEIILLFGVLYLVYEIMYFSYMYVVRTAFSAGWKWLDTTGYSTFNLDQASLDYVTDHPVEYTLLSWLVIMIILLMTTLVTRGSFLGEMSFKWLGIQGFLITILIGIGLVFAINGVAILITESTDYVVSYLPEQVYRIYDLVWLLITAGLLTPMFEELYFRDLVMGRLRRSFGPMASVLLAALVFSASHLNPVQGFFVLPLAILCGVLVVRTGSVLSAIWLHVVYNALNIYLAKTLLFQYNSLQLLIMVVFGLGLMLFGLIQVTARNVV